jgi:hypothetical protein
LVTGFVRSIFRIVKIKSGRLTWVELMQCTIILIMYVTIIRVNYINICNLWRTGTPSLNYFASVTQNLGYCFDVTKGTC